MGGILKGPKVPDYDARARAEAERDRQKEIERRKRGMESNIHTSYTGVLGGSGDSLKRKNLLGE